jgi:hypothetical protein
MNKIKLEFINICSCCDGYGDLLRDIQSRNPAAIDLEIYYAGKDFAYLPKYGPLSKSTLIINENQKIENLSRRIIEESVREALAAR